MIKSETRRRKTEFLSSLFLFLAALGTLAGVFGIPVARSIAMRAWPVVPCQIKSGSVIAEHTQHLTLYKADILYSYSVAGAEYHSNQYSPTDFRTPWFSGKRRLVRQSLGLASPRCYVNPHNPSQAFLTRQPSPSLLWSVCCIAVIGVGAGGMYVYWPHKPATAPVAHSSRASSVPAYLKRSAAVLGLLSGCALLVALLAITASDLLADRREGVATVGAYIIVAILGAALAGCVIALMRLARSVADDDRYR